MAQHSYRIGIDIGGTFTDIVVARDDGLVETRKVPSTPDDYSRGIAEAAEGAHRGLPDDAGRHHRHRPRHHGRDQRHPRIQGRTHRPPHHRGLSRRARDAPPAHPGALRPAIRQAAAAGAARHLGWRCAERMGPDGRCACRWTRRMSGARPRRFRDDEVEAVAISFLHAYANPAHEIAAEAHAARGAGRRTSMSAAARRSCPRSASTSAPRPSW